MNAVGANAQRGSTTSIDWKMHRSACSYSMHRIPQYRYLIGT